MNTRNILISDANHGGLVLLEEYSKYTQNNLFFYDIYDKLDDNEKKSLSKRFNVTFLSLDEILENEDSFIKINPVHMPPHFGTDFTHHEFVSYLLNKMNVNFKLIQVTGVKGKTTVVSLLRNVFKNYNNLVLTSENLTYNDEILMEKLSITPASIITAINIAKEENILDSIDYAIFEVSLGVAPHGYINVLTNILEDYPIAAKSSSASVAKKSVFSSEYTICDYDSFHKFYHDRDNVLTVSFDNPDADIYSSNIDYDIQKSRFTVNYFDSTYDIEHFALSDFYINNLLFAINAGLLADIDIQDIISNLGDSDEIEGRNSHRIINDKLVIEDVNPGLNTTSIKKCVDNLKKYSQNYTVIIGGDYGITCEEIDEEKLSKYLESIDPEKIVFAGDVGLNLMNVLDNKYLYFKNLSKAIDFCIYESNKKIIQIIYRSEYNSENKIYQKISN